MTLYRCAYQNEVNSRGILIHRVEKNEKGIWARIRGTDVISKIVYDAVVLELEVARLVSPFIPNNLDGRKMSEYHICLYKDYTVAIVDENWSKYFVPIETKAEE